MKSPKIILWDIETLPNLDKALEYWPQLKCDWKNVLMTRSLSSIICIGWKELGKKRVHCINAWDYKNWKKNKNDDYEVCKAMYDVLKDADAIVTHNGRRFDWKFLQTALLMNGLPKLPNIPHIDTKAISSKHLTILNNRLDTVSHTLGLDGKLENGGWKLWVDTHKDKAAAKKLMEKYCKQDVQALEDLYYKLRPFMKNIPNYNLFNGEGENRLCPSCGGNNLHKHGTHVTKTAKYQRYICRDCGTTSRGNKKDTKVQSL